MKKVVTALYAIGMSLYSTLDMVQLGFTGKVDVYAGKLINNFHIILGLKFTILYQLQL